MFRSSVKVLLATLFISLLFGCNSTPGEASLKAFKKNEAKFVAMIPQWSQLVPVNYSQNSQPSRTAYLRGKIVVVYRPEGDYRAPGNTEYKLGADNEYLEWHKQGLIAHSPDEVGTVVIVKAITKNSYSYQGAGRSAIVWRLGYDVYVVNLENHEIVGSQQLNSKIPTPETVTANWTIAPTEELHAYISSLPRR